MSKQLKPDYSEALRRITCIIFFGTPHQGTSVEPLKKLQQQYGSTRAAFYESVEPDSDILGVLRSTLTDSRNIKFVTCIEQQRPSEETIYVDKHQASIYSSTEDTVLIDSDHKNMNKFGYGNQSYHDIARHIEQAIKGSTSTR